MEANVEVRPTPHPVLDARPGGVVPASSPVRPEGFIGDEEKQYSLGRILGIWALVAVPMALLAWAVVPAVIPYSPLAPGITYWLAMIAGMGWEFILSMLIVHRELGTWRWSAIRKRTWLEVPRDPATDQPNPKLFWWVVPALAFAVLVVVLAPYLNAPMARLFPELQPPAFTDMSRLASPQFKGQWWLLGVALISIVFNYFLGEEFVFRGVLLPRMRGVFGKWDWVANAVLFGAYHLHKPWMIPELIVGALAITWPTRRFQSSWMAVMVHGAEGVVPLVVVLAVILGLTGS